MKKVSKISLIVAVILIVVGVSFLIINKNNKQENNDTKENLITFDAPKDIKYKTAFINNNSEFVILLENNSNESIVNANLKIKFNNEEKVEEINFLNKDSKYMVVTKIPENLVNNINNEKINITLDVIKKKSINNIDLSSLNNNINYTPIENGEYINIDIKGNNTTSKDISFLTGIVVLYNNNKIVEAKTFGIENIKAKSNFSYVISCSNVNYEKLEIYYTNAF